MGKHGLRALFINQYVYICKIKFDAAYIYYAVLLGQPTVQPDTVQQIILEQAQAFANDLLSDLRERKLELKSGHIVFSGGGALLLRRQIEASGKVVHPVFIDDVAANVRGFQLLYQAERLGHNGR